MTNIQDAPTDLQDTLYSSITVINEQDVFGRTYASHVPPPSPHKHLGLIGSMTHVLAEGNILPRQDFRTLSSQQLYDLSSNLNIISAFSPVNQPANALGGL